MKFKKLFSLIGIAVFTLAVSSCNNKSYDEMTPEQQQKEYIKFQKDSVQLCTENKRLVESAAKGAFDRIPENNGYYKADKVTCVYDEELKCWIATVDYHVDRNNTYYQTQAIFHVKYWYENNGLAKDGKLFYTVKQVNEAR